MTVPIILNYESAHPMKTKLGVLISQQNEPSGYHLPRMLKMAAWTKLNTYSWKMIILNTSSTEHLGTTRDGTHSVTKETRKQNELHS